MESMWQDLLYRFRWQVLLLLVGLSLAGMGILLSSTNGGPQIEILDSNEASASGSLVVEVSGAVNKPGVYEFSKDKRVDDAISSAGGLADEADKSWVEKYLNRAASLVDGQKIYIPLLDEQTKLPSDKNIDGVQSASPVLGSDNALRININTASLSQLESLKGIGPVTGQKIIDNRPYSGVSDLLVKKIISQKVFDENKELLTVY